MQPSDFKDDAPGKLVRIPEGHCAFVPDPLPPSLEFNPRIAQSLAEASFALGALASIAEDLPDPQLLVGPLLCREAVLSSRADGYACSVEELLLFEAGSQTKSRGLDLREVSNYVAALEHGLRRLKEQPASLRLVCEMHAKLMCGVRGEDRSPGEFRHTLSYITGQEPGIEYARFVPPPVPEMEQALDELERFISSSHELPLLIQLALIHYQFVTIHPFLEANGRMGRMLALLLLAERDVLPQPLLDLSAYFERNRDAYFDHLLDVSQRGTWSEWVQFFLDGLAEQARRALSRSRRLLHLRRSYRERLQSSSRPSAVLLRLLDQTFACPAFSASQARERLEVAFPSAQLNIHKLVVAGILQEATGRRRNRIYTAPDIISILAEDAA